jgi:hypothetical protein
MFGSYLGLLLQQRVYQVRERVKKLWYSNMTDNDTILGRACC